MICSSTAAGTRPQPLTAVLLARYSPRPERANASDEEKRRNAEDLERNSCDKQLEHLRARAAERGYIVDESLIFREDAVSGGNRLEKRKVMRAAVEAACKRGRVLMVRDIERLGRSLETFQMICQLQRKRSRLETIDEGLIDLDNPHQLGWIGMRIINGIVYRLTSAKRTRDRSREHQARGRRMSSIAPYGYQVDPVDASRLVPTDDGRRLIERIRELRRNDGAEPLSFSEIARRLTDEGFPCRGPRWNHNAVRRILSREDFRQRTVRP